MLRGETPSLQPYIQPPVPNGFQAGPASTQVHASPVISDSSAWAQEYTPERLALKAKMQEVFAKGKANPRPPHVPGKNLSPEGFAMYQRILQQGEELRARRASSQMGQTQPMGNTYRPYVPPAMGMGINRMGLGMGGLANNYPIAVNGGPLLERFDDQGVGKADKGKGKMVELDDQNWEEQFAQIDLQDKEQEESMATERELDRMDRSVVESQTNFGDFESIWKGIQAEIEGASEFEAMRNGMYQWQGFDDFGVHEQTPDLGNYMFEQDNIFQDIANPFDEGVRIMNEGGNLSLAAIAFEAAVQKDPSHLQAWLYLGSVQAQNEKETPAIRALEQALLLDPNNLTALMGLAVSYTNEGYDSTAYRTLERWLSIRYPSIPSPKSPNSLSDLGFMDRKEHHEQVTSLFIRAAQLSPDADTMDPDVQVGLGVLFYGAEEYTKAVDCFGSALASTESGTANGSDQIHLLWNRLGATLANSGRSEEAINAYEQALMRKPNFVRARYNLGVSCINIGCYEQAAGHFLGALSMHAEGERKGRERAKELFTSESSATERLEEVQERVERAIAMNQSTNLYDTLRRVFSQMGRRDLAEKVVPGVDVEEFRGEFEF